MSEETDSAWRVAHNWQAECDRAEAKIRELESQLAAAHRAGAREACAKLSDWAFGAMEGEDLEAFTAYENCHVSAENLKAHYAEPEEEKKG